MSVWNTEESAEPQKLLAMAARIAAIYVENNPTPIDQVPEIVRSVYRSLQGLRNGAGVDDNQATREPAVPIKRSVRPDYLICLEDGKRLKMLRRYLKSQFDLTPEAYRMKWGLPPDYPMVAPNYAQQRSEFAKKIGLGRSRRKS
jgi:predicted transcriptional regulator